MIEDIAALDNFARSPWNLRYLQGHIDAPFVNLTPGTRSGIIHDSAYTALCDGLGPLERTLVELIEAQCRAEEEQASREQLRTIQRAFREALLALPAEEYDWFDIHARAFKPAAGTAKANECPQANGFGETFLGAVEPTAGENKQRHFFEFAGPLFSVAISPASSIVRVGDKKVLRALPRDRSRRRVDEDLQFKWQLIEGPGTLTDTQNQAVTFLAPAEPGLARVKVAVRQHDSVCVAEGLITVTHELLAQLGAANVTTQGLPSYTFERAPGESWRSRFDRSALGTLTVVAFYLIAQMVGAGKLIELLFGMPYLYALMIVGALMILYVALGGMLATTWVQIIKSCLLLGGATVLAFLVLVKFGFSPAALFKAAVAVHPKGAAIMAPGALLADPISAVSLGLALMFGTAGLPHVLMRFYTVADAKAARKSVLYATGFIGYFYVLTFIIGFGAIAFLMNNAANYRIEPGGAYNKVTDLIGGTNMAAVQLANAAGGSIFLGFISAVAFATILGAACSSAACSASSAPSPA